MISTSPKLSVVIPVYNAEHTLNDTIDSILSQGCTEYEIVLMDDGSFDTCANLCDELAENHSGLIRCYHQPNQGSMKARINALKYCNGEYVTYIDADDIVVNNAFSRIFNDIESGFDLYLYDYYLKRINNDELEYLKTFETDNRIVFDCENNKQLYLAFLSDKINSMCAVVSKRNKLIECSGFADDINEKIIVGEDRLQKLHLILNVDSCVYIPDAFYIYKLNESSQSANLQKKMYKESQYRDFKTVWGYERKNYHAFKLTKQEVVDFDMRKVNRIITLLQDLFDNKEYDYTFKKAQAYKIAADLFFIDLYEHANINDQRTYIRIFANLLINKRILTLYVFARSVAIIRSIKQRRNI